jgi:hypothetical protein
VCSNPISACKVLMPHTRAIRNRTLSYHAAADSTGLANRYWLARIIRMRMRMTQKSHHKTHDARTIKRCGANKPELLSPDLETIIQTELHNLRVAHPIGAQ